MAGKIKEIKILGYDFVFVFRHRYEKDDDGERILNSMTMFSEWELGFFFKRMKVVGKKNFNRPKEWGNNLVHQYMVGINLLWCKAWFTVSKGTMKINIDEK